MPHTLPDPQFSGHGTPARPALHVQRATASPLLTRGPVIRETAQPQSARAARPTPAAASLTIQGCFPGGLASAPQALRQTGAIQAKVQGSAVHLPAGLSGLGGPGGGQPLPEPTRRHMEAVFGADLSHVRIHVGAAASALGAAAFTHGSHIHFAPGRYQPDTVQGRQLLGHELTHVLQQKAGRVRNTFGSGVAVVQDPRLEAEAERMAARAAQQPRQQVAHSAAARPVRHPGVGQARMAVGGGSCVQRASMATESSQSTYLTAVMANGTALCEDLASSAAGHSEDRFIDQTLPAAVAAGLLDAKADNHIFIGINRSPCSSTDRAGDGTTTCTKGGAAAGCTERLITLVTTGFTSGMTNYPIRLTISIRNVYDMSPNSVLANEAMIATGRIDIEFQKIGGSSTRFMGTKTAMELST